MIVRLKEKAQTTIGPLEPGLVDMPVVDVMRLVREGLVDILEDDEDLHQPITRRNGMIKSYMVR